MKTVAIRGDTRLIALFGNPVGHSLSPAIHNHAFASLGLNYAYAAFAVEPEQIATAMQAMGALGFAGANVTIPHKQAVVPYCDVLSDVSKRTGTVNTLYFSDGKLHGTTTDAEGFERAVEKLGYCFTGGTIVIIGNGGTARTLAIALASRDNITSVALTGRNGSRVAALADEVSRITGRTVAAAQTGTPTSATMIEHCTLLVNCTSAGMRPHMDTCPVSPQVLHPGITVFDTVYNPAETVLLRHARETGCMCGNGLTMLLYQGLASLKYWTGADVAPTLFDLDELQGLIER